MKTKIITVMERPDSVKHAEECVQSCKNFSIEAEIYPAFWLDAGSDYLKSKNISIRLNLVPRMITKMSGRGVMGCFASHFSLWEKCAAASENFLILEEDALMIRALPDFPVEGVLNLDPLIHDRADYLPQFDALQKQDIDEIDGSGLALFNMTVDGEAFNYLYGAYAYILTPAAAATLVSTTFRRGYLAADAMINDATVPIKSVTRSVFPHRPRDYSLSRAT